ncbi:MAG: DUF305 domain-containing protein [Gemmatimonadaceae bacterium]|nr:DUF305 domain-containing protein [Gemmatimonadaceae bacterium]
MSLRNTCMLAPLLLCGLSACASSPSRAPVLAAGAGVVGAGSAATTVALATADSAARAFAPADVDFMQGMIPHHAQAVIMGEWAATHGARADVQRLCLRIVAAQSDEIHMMRRWLRERKQDVPDSTATRHVMKMGDMTHEMTMPGMLSDEEMAQLDNARGSEFDRLFLNGMIRHHRGAIAMVETLLQNGNAGHDDAVFRFANDVVSDQSAEIIVMLRMLETVPSL